MPIAISVEVVQDHAILDSVRAVDRSAPADRIVHYKLVSYLQLDSMLD